MATSNQPTEQRECHTLLSQRFGALALAANGMPVDTAPTERVAYRPVLPAVAAAKNALAAANQSSQTPPAGTCQVCVTLSFFFDGTGNNLDADVGTLQHSNVARLLQSHPLDDPNRSMFSFYIPGIGTYFKDVNDPGHTRLGLGMGAKGQARLDWALDRFKEAIASASRRALNPTNKILRISVSVFGFSRGATAARAFVRELARLCELRGERHCLKAGGHPVEVIFLGIFDTVASVGVPMSGNNTPLAAPLYSTTTKLSVRAASTQIGIVAMAFGEPGADPAPGDFDGHASWADGLQVPAHLFVKRCVHMAAGHEIRNSFPCDSVLDGTRYSPGVSEMVYPGAHSNVGGGYQPGEGARGRRQGGMLSLLPLLAMHAAAREAGVPLYSIESLQKNSSIRRFFALDEEGKKNYNGMAEVAKKYLQFVGSGGRSIGGEMLAHWSWYLRWHFFNIRRNERSKGSGPDAVAIREREPGFAVERRRHKVEADRLESAYDEAQGRSARAQALLRAQQMQQARTGIPIASTVQHRAVQAAADEANAKDAFLMQKAKLDTFADDSELEANMAAFGRRLVQDAEAVIAHHASFPRLKLRPHYRNLVDAYRAHYIRQDPLDPGVIAFFDEYVHDSLAGFAQDATLPSDPRVIYAGGDNKMRFAAVDMTPTTGSAARGTATT